MEDQLVVTTQPPGSATAAVPFGLVVKVEDGQGNAEASFNGSVTVAAPVGVSLGGALTVNAVNGVATFAGLTLNQAGSYTLSLRAGGVLGTTTGVFTVAAGPARQLSMNSASTASAAAGNSVSWYHAIDARARW